MFLCIFSLVNDVNVVDNIFKSIGNNRINDWWNKFFLFDKVSENSTEYIIENILLLSYEFF